MPFLRFSFECELCAVTLDGSTEGKITIETRNADKNAKSI